MNVPSRRKDISIKEDLIEEVARIYGYDDIPSTLPVFKDVTSGELTDRQFKTRTVKETLEGAGLNQAITYSLVSKIMLPILRYKIVLQLNYLCL